MGLESKTKSINGVEYTVTQLGAKEGRRLLTRLLKVAGPALGEAAKAGGVGSALEKIALNLNPDDIDYFCETLERTTTVRQGERNPRLSDISDLHFAGNYGDEAKWLVFAMEVNFGSFLALAGDLKSAANESPASPQA